jgi:hypothetical protein
MGAEKKAQMLMGEFESALDDNDGDAVLATGREILEMLRDERSAVHKLYMEIRHLELTREEREAITSLCYFTEQPDQKDDVMAKYAAATLRGLLSRTKKSDYKTQCQQPQN